MDCIWIAPRRAHPALRRPPRSVDPRDAHRHIRPKLKDLKPLQLPLTVFPNERCLGRCGKTVFFGIDAKIKADLAGVSGHLDALIPEVNVAHLETRDGSAHALVQLVTVELAIAEALGDVTKQRVRLLLDGRPGHRV